jgi:uncharacterized protein (TIGR02145 family)
MKKLNNAYKTTQIIDQIWLSENLNVYSYRNGDEIPQAINSNEWLYYCDQKIGAWCYYDYNQGYEKIYGKLYNWYAVNDPKVLAPEGWRIPSMDDWLILAENVSRKIGILNNSDCLNFAGSYLKATSGWMQANGSDDFKFSVLPGGFHLMDKFEGIEGRAYFWTSVETSGKKAWAFEITGYEKENFWGYEYKKEHGFSVRCIKND